MSIQRHFRLLGIALLVLGSLGMLVALVITWFAGALSTPEAPVLHGLG